MLGEEVVEFVWEHLVTGEVQSAGFEEFAGGVTDEAECGAGDGAAEADAGDADSSEAGDGERG